jgi:hypothetical protein
VCAGQCHDERHARLAEELEATRRQVERAKLETARVRERAARDAATAARVIGQAAAVRVLAQMAARRLDVGDTEALIAAVQGIADEVEPLPA